jgi:hypothetical protein
MAGWGRRCGRKDGGRGTEAKIRAGRGSGGPAANRNNKNATILLGRSPPRRIGLNSKEYIRHLKINITGTVFSGEKLKKANGIIFWIIFVTIFTMSFNGISTLCKNQKPIHTFLEIPPLHI